MAQVDDYWKNKLSAYATEKWSRGASLFAQEASRYFPPAGDLLELGCGLAQDGIWFAEQGYAVTCADIVDMPKSKPVQFIRLNMADPLPFPAHSFDVVYAHLSIHYFTLERTKKLVDEIHDVLRPGGIFAFLANSVSDTEADEGEEIEPNFRRINGIEKRFFDIQTTKMLTEKFENLLLDDKGTSYKDQEAGLTQLIRFVGRKHDSK